VLEVEPLRDFVGLEDADRDTRTAMMEFSFQLAVGNLDEAFKAVRMIGNEGVWRNMARMCVTSKRLDVATVCMGRLGDAIAARALREAQVEPQAEAQVAALAIQLGMDKQAEQLYRECGRYDLLVRFLQDSGRWQDALDVAKESDRMHLRNTHYLYARHLEALGKTTEAIKHYELSETHVHEVPRLLLDDSAALMAYIKRSKNRDLLKWWAQYLESQAEMDEALKFYAAADDVLSLVRVYCYCDSVDTARQLVEKTKNKAAAYHLAR
jgi:intraflagellar transport protein 140